MLRRLACCVILPLLAAGCFIQQPDREFVDETKRHENLRSYDEIWQRVGSTYLNPLRQQPTTAEAEMLPRVNWTAIASDYRARVEQAGQQTEARRAMSDALEQLRQPHFALLPPTLKVNEGQSIYDPARSAVGLELAMLNDDVIVTRVSPGIGDANVQPGWTLLGIDEKSPKQIIRELRDGLPQDGLADVRILDHLYLMLDAGEDGSRVQATFATAGPTGRVRTVTLTRQHGDGDRREPIVAERLDDGVRLLTLRSLTDANGIERMLEMMFAADTHPPGLIIDLRGNTTGLSSAAAAILGHFVTQDVTKLGVILRRTDSIVLEAEPHPPQYAGPVAVLVDGRTMAAAEILARGVQDLRIGRVFGERTPGVAAPNTVARLTNGDRMQYAPADYVAVGSGRLEGVGVTPDQLVRLNPIDLANGRDAAMDAARAWIASQR